MPSLTIVLIPGAWHVDSAMDILSGQLQQRGFNTRTWGVSSVNRANVSIKDDTQAIRDGILSPLIEEQGKDVLLYLHSYAGSPGGSVINGLSKAERLATGKQGGVMGLIYQSAFVTQPGDVLLDLIGGTYTPWQVPNEETGLINVIDPKNVFYADVPEPLASEAANQIGGQSILTVKTPAGSASYQDEAYQGRRVYLHTSQDQALPLSVQNSLVSGSGVSWKEMTLHTSHSPFLSEPEKLADIVEESIQAFSASF
ncbi:uncharacterized protein KY384_007149 [Bacidia gigantensis]|uniref:uncharacterized protein n=1 Tax=Bacidia gigantensis TaxID=2732470 RepID=UPI001D03E303|nr:uncharacterized protein KY384_007149 [Bacidia gigantensis]KAG8528232.1 hypothetical protein KY384_007149 [Bacidia gigantensis]